MVEEKEPVLPLGRFLFPRIFQAFRLSLRPSKLAIAFLALTAICLTGWVMDFSRTVVVADRYTLVDMLTASGKPTDLAQPTELDVYIPAAAAVPAFIGSMGSQGYRTGVFRTLWHFGAEQFHRGLYALFLLDFGEVLGSVVDGVRGLTWAFRYHPAYSIVFFAVVLAVTALAGGALCRMTALEFAGGERLSLAQALRFGVRKFMSLFMAPLAPMVVILAFGLLFIALPGLVGNIPVVGELLVGLSFPLAILAAAVAAVFLVGTAAGLPLMLPAVAYEDSDCFDAIGRSFSYVYTALWRLGFYALVAAVYGAVCYVVVRAFAFLLLWLTYRFLQVGFLGHNEKLLEIWSGPVFDNFYGTAPTAPQTWSMWLGIALVRFWIMVVVGLVGAFIISFYFSASTIVYAAMRNRVDQTPLEEVYVALDKPAAAAVTETAAGATVPASLPQSPIPSGPALDASE
jgi:hypothetical protein